METGDRRSGDWRVTSQWHHTFTVFKVCPVPVLVLLLVSISWSLSCSLSALFLSSCSCRFKSFSCAHTITHTGIYFLITIFHARLLLNYSAKYILSLSSPSKFYTPCLSVDQYLATSNIYSPLHFPSFLKSSGRPPCPLSPAERRLKLLKRWKEIFADLTDTFYKRRV